ncbi:Uncharacterised protein [uncultured archaeon]|nr:Uncharacterised protein [uncultured archaeon]
MLVIMEYRYLQAFFQPLLHLKAARGADILQVDAAEDGLNPYHSVHNNGWVLGNDGDGKGINTSEVLEEDGLSLHHWDGGQGSNVAQTQNGRPVRHHGHHVALGGVLVNVICILLNLATGLSHPRRICQAQIPFGAAWNLASNGNLAPGGPMKQ